MATFRKVAAGWRAEVCVNGVRKSKVRPTKVDAKNWAAQAEFELGQMSEGVSITHTLNDVFEKYANEISDAKKGAQWEIVRLKMFARFSIAKVRLVDLRREHFEIYIVERLSSVKPSSVNRELNLISHCMTQARRWRLMAHNPMEDLKRPKDPPHRERRISQHEIDTILVALNYDERFPVVQQQQKTAVAFLLAIETAMRAGEICSLQTKNVDFERRTAFLPDTKNGYSRSIPLSQEAIRLFKRIQPWGGDGTVFGMTSSTLTAS